jgi:YihY family inner membrane protein
MSTAGVVPDTRDLSGDDAWSTLRGTPRAKLLKDAFSRLRVADGFSHARSLAFMLSLVAIEGVIALEGLAGTLGKGAFSGVISATMSRAVPGPAGNVLTTAIGQAHLNATEHHRAALLIGLIGCLVTATTAMGQIERGLNRLYGVEQDRPTPRKYGLAFVLALIAGTLSAAAFACLAFGRELFGTGRGTWTSVWGVARWPLGLLLIAGAVSVLFHWCPRRRQPHLSWLAFGSAVTVVLWGLATVGLGLFYDLSSTFGQTYGPLAGIVALLIWCLLSGVSLFFGAAVAAQLEAVRAGKPAPQDRAKVIRSEPDMTARREAARAS